MSNGTSRLGQRQVAPDAGRQLGAAMLVLLLAAAVGAGVSAGHTLYLLAAVTIAGAFAAAIDDWRRSVFGLLWFLPISGIFILAAYPRTGPATLLKDMLFVLPAYVGFAGSYLLRHRSLAVPGFPLGLATLLVAVVGVQMLNPTVPNTLVSLVGAKVWLLYIPMAYLGFHLLRTIDDLRRLQVVMVLGAIVPCTIGIVEGVLFNTGHADLVYPLYGDAAAPATQYFADVGTRSGGTISRVPSTFSFVGQYYLFTIAMTAVAYAYWRGTLVSRPERARWATGVFLLVIVAALLSGARGAILAIPAMVLLMLAFDGVSLRAWLWVPFAAAGAVALAALVFGTTTGDLLSATYTHAVNQFVLNTIDGFGNAFDRTLLGLGAGIDTVSARYALPADDPYALVGGRWEESWWVKTVLELGIIGLLLAVALIGVLLVKVVRSHRQLRDPELRSMSAGLIALMLFVIAFNFKASYLDMDPMNVLFWLFVGVLFRLPFLDQQKA